MTKTIDKLNILINDLHELLIENNLTISSAESCTSGLISASLTSLAGSSQYYLGGFNTYSNEIKTKLLGVEPFVIEEFGVVSSEVAEDMATNTQRILGTDYSISTTGLCEPTDDPLEPVVNPIWVGIHTPEESYSQLLQLSGTRKEIRQQVVYRALKNLYGHIQLDLYNP